MWFCDWFSQIFTKAISISIFLSTPAFMFLYDSCKTSSECKILLRSNSEESIDLSEELTVFLVILSIIKSLKYSNNSLQNLSMLLDWTYILLIDFMHSFALPDLIYPYISERYSIPEIPRICLTESSFISRLQAFAHWSSIESASRIAPSAHTEIIFTASLSIFILSEISSGESRWKSNRWHRETIVVGSLWISVVAKMKTTWGGGSSKIFKNALNAPVESMWTSSTI